MMPRTYLSQAATLSRRTALTLALGTALWLPLSATVAEAAAKTALTLGMAVEPAGLDPTIAAPVAIGQVTWQNVFEGLVKIDREGKVKPQLAESWEISPDGKTYTFKLRKGVTFHDGEAFDSSVAKFSLDRARGESSVNPQKRFFASIDSMETPDAATLVLKLKQPAGSLLYWLGWPASVMVAPKSAENNRTTPIGTGPFKFVAWAKGDKVELRKNDAYWDKAVAVKLEKATFRFVSDPQAQAAALKSGDIDAFPEFGAPELMTSFDGDARLGTFVGNTELKVVAGMNNARKPFDDKRVRQALMMAVDRGTVIEGAWSGFGTAIGSHFSPTDAGYLHLESMYPYDPGRARALLKEAGVTTPLRLKLSLPPAPYAQAGGPVVAQYLAQAGIVAEIERLEWPQWLAGPFKGHFDMTLINHVEPLDYLIYTDPGYYFGYDSPAFRELAQRHAAAASARERQLRFADLQRHLAQDAVNAWIFAPKIGAVVRKGLRGAWMNYPIFAHDIAALWWEEDS